MQNVGLTLMLGMANAVGEGIGGSPEVEVDKVMPTLDLPVLMVELVILD